MTTTPQTRVTILAPIFPRVSQALTMLWADGQGIEPWQAQLVRTIGQSNWDAQHLPVADLLRKSSSEPLSGIQATLDGPLVCADPVHFRADRDTATLIPADMLHLRDSESVELLKSINDFLLPDNMQISRAASGQWVMSGKDGRELPSYPPSFLAHRNASAFLSNDEASGSWRRLMTELQMLLHAHPVNREREQRGLPSVNSVWFWGGASLQSGKPASGITPHSLRLFADDQFTVTIASYLGLSCEPLAAFDPASDHPHSLLVDTRLTQAMFADDEPGMDEAEQQIVNQWIAPIQVRIEAGEAITLEIFNEDGMHGRLNLSVVQAAAEEARVARVMQMSVIERLGDRLAGAAKSLRSRLRNTLFGKA